MSEKSKCCKNSFSVRSSDFLAVAPGLEKDCRKIFQVRKRGRTGHQDSLVRRVAPKRSKPRISLTLFGNGCISKRNCWYNNDLSKETSLLELVVLAAKIAAVPRTGTGAENFEAKPGAEREKKRSWD